MIPNPSTSLPIAIGISGLFSLTQTDREIDRMVYELYGLTGEEIRIVEERVG